jgi:hypothetical protein
LRCRAIGWDTRGRTAELASAGSATAGDGARRSPARVGSDEFCMCRGTTRSGRPAGL